MSQRENIYIDMSAEEVPQALMSVQDNLSNRSDQQQVGLTKSASEPLFTQMTQLTPESRHLTVKDLNRQSSQQMPEDVNTVGVMDSTHSAITLRELLPEVLYRVHEAVLQACPSDGFDIQQFSNLSNQSSITNLCKDNIPGWQGLQLRDIEVLQLCEGLSNQSFKVSILESAATASSRSSAAHQCVLFRVYGTEVSKMYDPLLELEIFRTLANYRIAPQMIAHGDGWRIEEWHFAVTLPCSLMNNPSVLCQVASNIGRMHKLHRREDFPTSIPRVSATSMRLASWGQSALEAARKMQNETVKAMRLDEIHPNQTSWLDNWLMSFDTGISGQVVMRQCPGLDLVFSHNDLQENNLLQTQYGLRMIDFEYAHFNYQAVDIANFFCEFTIDYVRFSTCGATLLRCWVQVSQKYHPFYTCNLSDFPSIEEQQLFIAVYLSEYLEMPILPSNAAFVQPLLENVQRFVLVSHLLWALWSVIRAPEEAGKTKKTFDEFDFIHYAKFRLDLFLRTKQNLLSLQQQQHDASNTDSKRAALEERLAVLETANAKLAAASGVVLAPKETPTPVQPSFVVNMPDAKPYVGFSTVILLGVSAVVGALWMRRSLK